MDLHHLRTFVVVAEERSFTKAAARLHISQPPISRHIRQLEEMLGAQLLSRNRQRVELTAEGHILLAKARAVISATDDVLKAAAQLRAGAIGAVKIGLERGLWNAAMAVRTRHALSASRVVLDVAYVGSSDQGHALNAGAIDIGFTRGGTSDPALNRLALFDEHIVVMLPSTHPLADAERVTLAELSSEAVGMSSSVVSGKVREMYSAAGVTPAATIDCPHDQDVDAIRMLVVSGRAIYFSTESRWTTSARVAGISTVRVDQPNASLSVDACWRKSERSSAVLALVDCIRATLADTEQQAAIGLASGRPANRIDDGHVAPALVVAPKRPAIFPTARSLPHRRRASG